MGVDEQNVFNVTVNKGQAIIANDNASVTATANIGADASELEKLIAAVRDKIGTIASDEDARHVHHRLLRFQPVHGPGVYQKNRRNL